MTVEKVAARRHPVMTAHAWHYGVVALIAFLTLVDLFAAQAILPSLVKEFDVSPAAMGFAVNASTFGMAAAGLAVAFFGRNLDRRNGIWISLVILALPTTLLAFTHDLTLFAVLRVAQGVCMATAFTLTMAYLAEHFEAGAATGVLAAYVTGNVASNFFGRLLSAAVADTLGLSLNFLTFAGLNLAGAIVVWVTLSRNEDLMTTGSSDAAVSGGAWKVPLADAQLRASFAIGFLILFVFIGTFTYVNFYLTAQPLSLSPMALGLVYFVFLPSMATTPLAGRLTTRLGARHGILATLALAVAGLAMLISPSLPAVLAGLMLVAVGTFLAQAMATGHVSRTARSERAAASGIYLASYYAGGLAGGFVLGITYDGFGWNACVAVLAAATLVAMFVARRLSSPDA